MGGYWEGSGNLGWGVLVHEKAAMKELKPWQGWDHIPGRAGAPSRHHHPRDSRSPGWALGTQTARTCCWPGFLAVPGRIWLRRNLEAALNAARNEKRLGATFRAEFSCRGSPPPPPPPWGHGGRLPRTFHTFSSPFPKSLPDPAAPSPPSHPTPPR